MGERQLKHMKEIHVSYKAIVRDLPQDYLDRIIFDALEGHERDMLHFLESVYATVKHLVS